MENKRKIGLYYEDMAVDYLKRNGYQILDRNYRIRGGELDIVAQMDGMLVICEVKYRSSLAQGNPFEAVDMRKQKQISKVTVHYLVKHGYGMDTAIRFDVIGIWGNGDVEHIKNAFYYSYHS